MESIKKVPLIAIVLMTILSFTNLFGLNIAGASIVLGVIFYFIDKVIEKPLVENSGLDIKSVRKTLKDKKIWIWLALPLIMDAVCIIISLLFLPEYIDFEISRAGGFVAIELSVLSILQFFVFALGEEIAWRALFQRQLTKALPIVPVLLISSALFALGHFKTGNPIVVAYGLVFIFINSFLYGVVFHKTQNAWVSTISHFVANIFEVIIFVLL